MLAQGSRSPAFPHRAVLQTCQSTVITVLTEIDAYIKIQPDIRFNFQAKQTREAGDPTQAEVGPGLDSATAPWYRGLDEEDL